MVIDYYALASYFIIYSFVGWLVEVIFQAVTKGKIVNRGFLNGPVCPIYGFGMVAVLLFFNHINVGNLQEASGLFLFVIGAVFSTVIELFGGWVLDKLFHTKWWDYSKEKFNFHGYICLRFSMIWGIGVVFIMHVIHPLVEKFSVHLIPEKIGWWIIAALFVVYFIDLIVTVLTILGLNKQIKQLEDAKASLRIVSDAISTRVGEEALKTSQKIGESQVQGELVKEKVKDDLLVKKAQYEKTIRETRENIETRKKSVIRLMKAFPELDMHEYQSGKEELLKLLDEMKENKK